MMGPYTNVYGPLIFTKITYFKKTKYLIKSIIKCRLLLHRLRFFTFQFWHFLIINLKGLDLLHDHESPLIDYKVNPYPPPPPKIFY